MIEENGICGYQVMLVLDVSREGLGECELAAIWPVSRCVTCLLHVLMRIFEPLVAVTLVTIGFGMGS